MGLWTGTTNLNHLPDSLSIWITLLKILQIDNHLNWQYELEGFSVFFLLSISYEFLKEKIILQQKGAFLIFFHSLWEEKIF